MSNIEIPADTWQAIQARAALNSSEEVSWPGKAIIQRAPNWQDEEVDCTYIAQCYKGKVWVDMLILSKWQDTSALTVQSGQQATSWQELRAPSGNGYLYKYFPSGSRRKRKSPARMSRKWRELRKEWH